MSETETWKIVKTTDNYKYFDCELYKNRDDDTHREVFWFSVITGLEKRYFYGKDAKVVQRKFIDSKGFKDLDADKKYVQLAEIIMKDSIVEIGYKKTEYGHILDRDYQYYKILEITDTEIKVLKITKLDALNSFQDVNVLRTKNIIIEKIKNAEDFEALKIEIEICAEFVNMVIKKKQIKEDA